jgi:hypothetical protein
MPDDLRRRRAAARRLAGGGIVKSSSGFAAKYVAPLADEQVALRRCLTATRSSGAAMSPRRGVSFVAVGSASVGSAVVVATQRCPDAPT